MSSSLRISDGIQQPGTNHDDGDDATMMMSGWGILEVWIYFNAVLILIIYVYIEMYTYILYMLMCDTGTTKAPERYSRYVATYFGGKLITNNHYYSDVAAEALTSQAPDG
jgi:hypothetical protein